MWWQMKILFLTTRLLFCCMIQHKAVCASPNAVSSSNTKKPVPRNPLFGSSGQLGGRCTNLSPRWTHWAASNNAIWCSTLTSCQWYGHTTWNSVEKAANAPPPLLSSPPRRSDVASENKDKDTSAVVPHSSLSFISSEEYILRIFSPRRCKHRSQSLLAHKGDASITVRPSPLLSSREAFTLASSRILLIFLLVPDCPCASERACALTYLLPQRKAQQQCSTSRGAGADMF